MFIPPFGAWSPNDRTGSIAFKPGQEMALRTTDLFTSLAGLSMVGLLLGREIERLAVRRSNGLYALGLSSSLALFITILSFLFFFFSLVMTHGIGLSLNQLACSVAFYGSLAFLNIVKFAFYAFLWQVTDLLWRGETSRCRSLLWRVVTVVVWVLVGIIAGGLSAAFSRRSHVELDEQCQLGIRKEGGIALLAVDLFVVLLLVSKITASLLYRVEDSHISAWKCLFGTLMISIVSVATIAATLILDGKEYGWTFLLASSCSSGLLAIVATWISNSTFRRKQSTTTTLVTSRDPAQDMTLSAARLVARNPTAASSMTFHPNPRNGSGKIPDSPFSIGMDPRDTALDAISLDDLFASMVEDTPYIVPSPSYDYPEAEINFTRFTEAPSPTNPLPPFPGPRHLSKARVQVKPYLSSISTAKSYSTDQWVPSTPVSPIEHLQSYQFPPLPTPESPDMPRFAPLPFPSPPHPFALSEPALARNECRHRRRMSSIPDESLPAFPDVPPFRIQRRSSPPVRVFKMTDVRAEGSGSAASETRRPSLVAAVQAVQNTIQNYWFSRRPSAVVAARASSHDEYQIAMYRPTRRSSMGTLEYDYAETVQSRS